MTSKSSTTLFYTSVSRSLALEMNTTTSQKLQDKNLLTTTLTRRRKMRLLLFELRLSLTCRTIIYFIKHKLKLKAVKLF
jgi:hypothetical protein